MPKTRTIELSEPIGDIEKIVLRPLTFADFTELGSPAVWVSLANGAGFIQETPAVIAQWIARLADVDDPNCLSQLCLKDALVLRAAVFEFFSIADATPPAAGRDQAATASLTLQ